MRGGPNLQGLDPFESQAVPCTRCGRSHFCFNSDGKVFCQRCGEPWTGRIARGVFGISAGVIMREERPDA